MADYSIGDTVTLDGIECLIVYAAETEQNWGRYICVDKNHDLIYYFAGTDYEDESESGSVINSANKYGYEWGGFGTPTGITDTSIGSGLTNTNSLIGMNLQPNTSGWNVVWDKVNEFRSGRSNKWFVPSKDELNLIYTNRNSLSGLTTINNSNLNPYYWSSSESNALSAWRQFFVDGSQDPGGKGIHYPRTRLCRYATDADLQGSIETIQISCSTPDASIRYTTDGSAPSVQSTLYEGQFEVTPPAMIKAKGYKTGMLSSDVAELEVTAPLEKLPTPVLLGFPESSGPFIDFLVELKVDGFENLENSNFMIKGGTHWNFDVVDSRSFENKGAGIYVINAPSDMYPEGTEFSVYVTADGYEDSDIMTFIYGIAPVTVPMALPDGSVLFYDRGESYGSYRLGDDGYPAREDSTTDDGSATSNNWRYLICDSANLSERREWGPNGTNEGMTDTKYEDFGYGLPNTETLLSKYSGNSSYIWQLVQNKRNTTGGKKWFVPSKDELNIVYQNKDTIVNAGGGSFLTDYVYWSSSEDDRYSAWGQNLTTGFQLGFYKNNTDYCRLLRRV